MRDDQEDRLNVLSRVSPHLNHSWQRQFLPLPEWPCVRLLFSLPLAHLSFSSMNLSRVLCVQQKSNKNGMVIEYKMYDEMFFTKKRKEKNLHEYKRKLYEWYKVWMVMRYNLLFVSGVSCGVFSYRVTFVMRKKDSKRQSALTSGQKKGQGEKKKWSKNAFLPCSPLICYQSSPLPRPYQASSVFLDQV